MKIRLLLLAPLLLMLAGCGLLSPDSSDGVIMPLAIGNQWMGRVTMYDSSGKVISRTYDTLSVVGSASIDGEIQFRMSTGEYYVNRADGLWCVTPSCDRLRARYPAAKGDRYDVNSVMVLLPDEPAPTQQTVAMEVLHTDTTVRVTAGAYAAYHYSPVLIEPTGARFISPTHAYYAPNVGPVLTETFGPTHTRWELVRAVLK